MNAQNEICRINGDDTCVFGNTDSIHVVVSKLTTEFRKNLNIKYPDKNICMQPRLFLNDITNEKMTEKQGEIIIRQYTAAQINWEFEEYFHRVIYPWGLKNKYIGYYTDPGQKDWSHETFERLLENTEIFIKKSVFDEHISDFDQYLKNSKFIVKDDKAAKSYTMCRKFVMIGMSTSQLPQKTQEIVKSYFLGLLCVEQFAINKQ